MFIKPKVVANTGDRLKAVWSNDGPTYGPRVGADDLDPAESGASPSPPSHGGSGEPRS